MPPATVSRGLRKAWWVPMDLEELVEHWTLLEDERELVGRKRGATRPGFALRLRFCARAGRLPRGRSKLPADVCQAERRTDRVRDDLLARCRAERIEPPSAGRCDRIVRCALHQAEQSLTLLWSLCNPGGLLGRQDQREMSLLQVSGGPVTGQG